MTSPAWRTLCMFKTGKQKKNILSYGDVTFLQSEKLPENVCNRNEKAFLNTVRQQEDR